MTRRMWGWVAAAVVAAALAVGTGAQTRTDVHPNKVLIRSTATDAVTTLGGVSAAGIIESANSLRTTAANPLIYLIESDGATDAKRWRMDVNGGAFSLLMEDDAASPVSVMTVTRSGAAVTGITLGTSGTPFVKVLSGSATWDPNNLQNTDGFDSTLVTVTGVTNTSPCFAAFSATLGVNITLQARYDTTNTVRAILNNHDTGSAYDPGSGTVRVTCVVY